MVSKLDSLIRRVDMCLVSSVSLKFPFSGCDKISVFRLVASLTTLTYTVYRGKTIIEDLAITQYAVFNLCSFWYFLADIVS